MKASRSISPRYTAELSLGEVSPVSDTEEDIQTQLICEERGRKASVSDENNNGIIFSRRGKIYSITVSFVFYGNTDTHWELVVYCTITTINFCSTNEQLRQLA